MNVPLCQRAATAERGAAMGSIKRDISGAWRARWRDPNGRSRSRNFDRKVVAEKFLVSVDHSKLAGGYIDPAAGRVLLRTWVEERRPGPSAWEPTSSPST